MSRDLVREALRRAPGSLEPDVAHLLERVPDLVARSHRRPAAASDMLAARAWRAIPRLAAATAAAVALAAIVTFLARGSSGDAASFESMILTGPDQDAGDVLRDALLAIEQDHD